MNQPASHKSNEILSRVCAALDTLIDCAEPYQGLVPALIDREKNTMMRELPPPIAGQRNGDRTHLGSNLIHDEATLKTLYGLGAALDRPAYRQAADRYLQRFATHCTATATGLFPWGEHSFWHFDKDAVGNSYHHLPNRESMKAIHDHLRQAPAWLWEKLYLFNPRCVETFAEGLEYHWMEGKREEYFRHASIEEVRYPTPDFQSADFPRHSGFYIFDWSFAYAKTGREDFLRQICDMLDYWWLKRDAEGLLLIESRSPETSVRFYNVNAPAQTLSLGLSLLESAALIETMQPALAATMRKRAGVYLEAFLRAPHDIERSVYVILCRRGEGEIVGTMPVWGSAYGVWPASYGAVMAMLAWRLTGRERLLTWAKAVGRDYIRRPLPCAAVPAMDAGLALALLADLYAATGEDEWLQGGLSLAQSALDSYCDRPLPKGALGIDWYESQMGPGFLLHGLARLALLAQDRDCTALDGDYTAR
jgi:hypothetical protein